MRIGFVSTYPPIECGIATYTMALNEALRKLENETFVISQFGAQGKGVFPLYKPQSPSFVSDVFSTSASMTPDVVHIQHEYGLYGPQKGVDIIGLILRYQITGIPVVTTLHTVSAKPDNQESLLLKNIIDGSSVVVVHEEFQRETLIHNIGPSDKIQVIEHGIREIEPISQAKKKLKLEGMKVIMLCGYFRPTKGYHKIIDLFPRICEQNKDIVLVVAGKTRNIEFDDYRRQLFIQMNNSPVVDRIEIFRGQFPQYTFDTLLSAADVVVLPYETGAQSGMMAQCFAMNKPVAASNLVAFKELIERSGGGLICENDDDYITNICRILNDNDLQKVMKENIRKYISTHAGWSLIALKHIDVYHSVVTVPYGKARYVYFHEPEKAHDQKNQ
ncbi:MAG: glycosyltransferase [Planctomycetes bacterium]|nr:glycosyltransferase [Planctomycetota bacterium]